MIARSLALATAASVALAAVAAGVLLVLTASTAVPAGAYGFRGSSLIFGMVATVVGTAVALRHPRNTVGWIFLFTGWCAVVFELVEVYAVYAVLLRGGALPGGDWAAWVGSWLWIGAVVPTSTLLPLVFPNGRTLSPRWSWLAWSAVAVIAAFVAATALVEGPLYRASFVDSPVHAGAFAIPAQAMGPVSLVPIALVVPCALGAVLRFRRSTGVERQQMKWFVYGAVVVGSVVVLIPIFGGAPAYDLVSVLSVAAIPVSAGIAILRYRLYDIDILIRRTIVYGTTTAALGTAFFAVIVLLQRPLGTLTGGSELAVVISTVACYGLFQPVRGRIQRAVDRRFYRSKYDANRALDSFAGRLRDEVDLESVRADLLEAAREMVQPAHASIWLRESES